MMIIRIHLCVIKSPYKCTCSVIVSEVRLKRRAHHEEQSRQVRDTVVEKCKAGFGYKNISQALNIPRSTVQAIILKWKEYQTTANLRRPGRPSKLSAHTSRRLIRDAAKRPMITLDELQRSTAEVGDSVHRTTISRILHKSGLYGRVARRKPFLKDP
uniref:Transposase Tc1-like domain-containing protein n=1 Tax=Esox lucius TaxID=8010 RepID=A0AAY5KKQ0_ESOLU